MIPELTLDLENIKKQWKNEEDQEWVKDFCKEFGLCNELGGNYKPIPIYQCDNNWVDLGVFNEFKKAEKLSCDYGYCDREEDLHKYLQTYINDTENNYLVNFGFMSMDYEKYYKNGSYINKNGINTQEDYYNYINENQDDGGRQQFSGKWLTYSIYKLIKE